MAAARMKTVLRNTPSVCKTLSREGNNIILNAASCPIVDKRYLLGVNWITLLYFDVYLEYKIDCGAVVIVFYEVSSSYFETNFKKLLSLT